MKDLAILYHDTASITIYSGNCIDLHYSDPKNEQEEFYLSLSRDQALRLADALKRAAEQMPPKISKPLPTCTDTGSGYFLNREDAFYQSPKE